MKTIGYFVFGLHKIDILISNSSLVIDFSSNINHIRHPRQLHLLVNC